MNNSNLRFINPLKSYRRSEHHQEKDYYVIPYSEANKGPQYFSINMDNYTIVPVDDHLQDGFSIVIVTFNEKYLLKTYSNFSFEEILEIESILFWITQTSIISKRYLFCQKSDWIDRCDWWLFKSPCSTSWFFTFIYQSVQTSYMHSRKNEMD